MSLELRLHPASREPLRLALLASLPAAFAVAGALYDEHQHLGLTNWRSACRSAGFSLGSLITFTFELLPAAIIGMLIGGLAVQLFGVLARRRGGARTSLAAHAGCVVSMPLGLPLCALALPLPVMLVTDVLLALVAAACVHRLLRDARAPHP